MPSKAETKSGGDGSSGAPGATDDGVGSDNDAPGERGREDSGVGVVGPATPGDDSAPPPAGALVREDVVADAAAPSSSSSSSSNDGAAAAAAAGDDGQDSDQAEAAGEKIDYHYSEFFSPDDSFGPNGRRPSNDPRRGGRDRSSHRDDCGEEEDGTSNSSDGGYESGVDDVVYVDPEDPRCSEPPPHTTMGDCAAAPASSSRNGGARGGEGGGRAEADSTTRAQRVNPYDDFRASYSSIMMLVPNMDDELLRSLKGDSNGAPSDKKLQSQEEGDNGALSDAKIQSLEEGSGHAALSDEKPYPSEEGDGNGGTLVESLSSKDLGLLINDLQPDLNERWHDSASSSQASEKWNHVKFAAQRSELRRASSLSAVSVDLDKSMGGIPGVGDAAGGTAGEDIPVPYDDSLDDILTVSIMSACGSNAPGKVMMKRKQVEEGNAMMKRKQAEEGRDVRLLKTKRTGVWTLLPAQLLRRRDVRENRDDELEGGGSNIKRTPKGENGPTGSTQASSRQFIKTSLKAETSGMKHKGSDLEGGKDKDDGVVDVIRVKSQPSFACRIVLGCASALIFLVLVVMIPLLVVARDQVVDFVSHGVDLVVDGLPSLGTVLGAAAPPTDGQYDMIDEDIDLARQRVPGTLRYLLDVDAPAPGLDALVWTALPLVWSLDRSGSDVLVEAAAACLNRKVASDLGGSVEAQAYTRETQLRVVNVNGVSYVNVNLQSPYGIDRAASLSLVSSHFADVAVSPELYDASVKLFDATNNGRLVCMLRHPVDRELANYQNLVESGGGSISGLVSLETYVSQFGMQEDYAVRALSGNGHGNFPATEEMLQVAKDVVRTKCLLGLHEDMGASVSRFVDYFGWGAIADAPPSARPCLDEARVSAEVVAGRLPDVQEGDPVYDVIVGRNSMDMKLYQFAIQVFEEQGRTLFDEKQPVRRLPVVLV